MRKVLNQRQRTIALFLNIALAVVVHRFVSGRWMVTGDAADAWLVGICAYWILLLVSAPFFSPPKDALANALGAFIALITLGIASESNAFSLLSAIKGAGLFLSALVLTLALVAISSLASKGRDESSWAYRLANRFGRGQLIFTPVILISAFAGYGENLPAVLSIVTLWSIAIGSGVFETLLLIRMPAKAGAPTRYLGTIERFDSPGLVRVLLHGAVSWSSSSVVALKLPDRSQVLALPLFEHPGVEGRIGTAIVAEAAPEYIPNIAELEVHACEGEDLRDSVVDRISGLGPDAVLAGIVVEGASIAALRFEVVSQLEKGQMVAVRLPDGHVYYQITDAVTAEEALSGEVYGRRIATAIQLGRYESSRGFVRYDWVPPMNSCVFVVSKDAEFSYSPKSDQRSLGKLPGTECNVYFDIDEIVHYHAAILGITGTGKTELSLDIVRASVEQGCKVVCVDFTGEYSKRLDDLKPKQLGLSVDLGQKYEDAIFAVETGAYGAGAEKAALKRFVDEIKPMIEGQVDGFLTGEDHLSVLELSEITNTKATLRTTELFLSAFMSWARRNRRRERILLVLEEAHTIVPESGGSGMDYDSKWVVDRIGQIALQGRKYGIGLLVLSQRTALVSKTILSQCNTFFTFALVDQTSLTFLGSIFSKEHVLGIPNLNPLEFVCYGRGINSARPLLARREFDASKLDASNSLNCE